MHKYLFNINYNNKIFSLFLNEQNKIYFLINNNGKYFYPSYEEYIYLNNMYNEKNFISYLPLKIEEKVIIKNTAVSLALLTALNISTFGSKTSRKMTINSEIVSTQNIIQITSLESLNSIIEYQNISLVEVINTINLNKNISLDDKKRAITLINTIYNNYPEFDFRIFNENMKTLKIVTLSDEDIIAKFSSYIAGCYYTNENTIYLSNSATEKVIYHELSHTLFDYYHAIGPNVYYHYNLEGKALSEAMNANITSLVLNDESYKMEKDVLNYLCYFASFDIQKFNETGINGLVSTLKNKYSDIDINYIVKILDAMFNTRVSLGEKIYLDDINILDELFKYALKEASNKQNKYEPFEKFANILRNTYTKDLPKKYFEMYNDNLEKNGKSIISYDKVLNYGEGEENYTYANGYFQKGDSINKEDYCTVTIDYSSDLFKIYALANISKINEPNFVDNIIKNTEEVSPYLYEEIPFYYKGRFLFAKKITTNMMIEITKDVNNEVGCNLYENDELIYNSNKSSVSKSNLISLLNYITFDNNYIKRIDLACYLTNDYLSKYQESNNLYFPNNLSK